METERHYALSVDPGNITGLTWGFIGGVGFYPQWKSVDLTPKKATKKRVAELEHMRYAKLWTLLQDLVPHDAKRVTIICEGAAGFMRGKKAIEVSNQYRGVVKCFAGVWGYDFESIEPNDLKFFATGKRSAEKPEMIQAANRMGYIGNEDNEADSYLMWKFLEKKYVR